MAWPYRPINDIIEINALSVSLSLGMDRQSQNGPAYKPRLFAVDNTHESPPQYHTHLAALIGNIARNSGPAKWENQ